MRVIAAFAVIPMLLGLAAASASAQAPGAFDPREHRQHLYGAPTQVLVIGTPHLSGAPDDFDPAVLEPILERLAAFGPDIIAIENLSGESVHALKTYEAVYPESADWFGGRFLRLAAVAEAETGLGMPAAEAEARRLLAALPENPTPAQRRRLAAVLTAAGDAYSALVQWWRLDAAERRAGDGISGELAVLLDEYETRRNESHMIAVRLAVRLGLDRVYPVDDHHGDDIMGDAVIDDMRVFMEQADFAAHIASPEFQYLAEASERLGTPEDALETYRFLNSPEAGITDVLGQWVSMIDRASPNSVGRVRIAEWETRNLRQVAHIREAAAQSPGGRVLVIVGSAHKPWFDAYLGMMIDMTVVDAGEVLR
ncbi:hypothetical protein IWC96_08315 [Brevundimonas sp. BAL450]|jgi:hypothetical protein|nr:DUF5694 domain-containing protein [Brevundimonas sp. BAL450]MBG7615286.1 hypothetical protein [Brevundimonas sp. BAL450]